MNPEAQRIAIAEACGWTNIYKRVCDGQGREWHGARPDGWGAELPDYLNDLNAMHESENTLFAWNGFDSSKDDYGRFIGWLENITQSAYFKGKPDSEEHRKLVSATATQRAEAFLRTIGKWEDAT